MPETTQQPIDGEVTRLWRARPWLLQLALGLFVGIGAAYLLTAEQEGFRAVALWAELVLGAALALFALGSLLLHVRNNPRLIIGEERMQYVRGDRVFVDVAYAQIEDVGLDKYGWFLRAIGIHLIRGGEPTGTANKAIRFLQKRFGYDALIPADLSDKRIGDLVMQIRTRVEEQSRPPSDDE